MTFAAVPAETSQLDPSKFSSFRRLVRITAWCRRVFQRTSRNSSQESPTEGVTHGKDTVVTSITCNGTQVPELSIEECKQAEEFWIRKAQHDVYAKIINQLAKGKPLTTNETLSNLSPQLQAGILRVGGRLQSAHHISDATRHPIILPA